MAEKSRIDENKERNELEILERVVLLSKGKKKLTRDILSLLEGENIERIKNDRPDIVKKCIRPQEKAESFIGIEHFRVEQGSITERGKRISYIEKNKKHMQKIASEREQYQKDSDQYRKIVDEFVNTSFSIATKMNLTGVPELKESFHVALNKHLANIPDYRSHLMDLSHGEQINLAFLIEIRCITGDIFLNNGRTVKRRTHSVYPVLDWMIEELERIEQGLLDYTILYIRKPFCDEEDDVVAIDMKDIRGSLRRQGIIVYHYCNSQVEINITNLGYSDNRIGYTISVEDQSSYLLTLLPGLQEAYEYKQNGIPFAAPREIQEMLYACGKRYDASNPLQSIFHPETLKRFDEFSTRYSIEDTPEQNLS